LDASVGWRDYARNDRAALPDPRRNMARFYSLSIEETLFGQARLVRRWGRIGTTGRTVQHSFDNESEAVSLFLELLIDCSNE
jgi:predicted DNA-binding WGR domain protein